MRDAARALDDVSDHLGEVLRHADELLADWSRFGAQVRAQVDREALAIGEVVDGAVARATSVGVERAVSQALGDRVQSLATELSKLEARTRAASRAVSDQRAGDRRILWIAVGGIGLANLLLALVLWRSFASTPVPIAAPLPVPTVTAPTPVEVAPSGTATVPTDGTSGDSTNGSNGADRAGAANRANGSNGSSHAGPLGGTDGTGAADRANGSNGSNGAPGPADRANGAINGTSHIEAAGTNGAGSANGTAGRPNPMSAKSSLPAAHKKLP